MKLQYKENYFIVGNLIVINAWGKESKTLPEKVCINLSRNTEWTILHPQKEGLYDIVSTTKEIGENTNDPIVDEEFWDAS